MNAKLKRQRYWQCPSCTIIHERNFNAAVNLRNLLTLPPGRGTMLCNGKALVRRSADETGPNDRRTASREPVLSHR
ncbi:MAG: transposase [Dehalococcoidia bacterium]|nr:transposase [Dehalococcoidia bacterium]